MNALRRLSALGFALALASCSGQSDSDANADGGAPQADDPREGTADEPEADDAEEGAGAAASGGRDGDLFEPFVDESRRAARPEDAQAAAPTAKTRPAPPKDRKPPTQEALGSDDAQRKAARGAESAITTPDGKTVKIRRGGSISPESLRPHSL